MNTISAVIGVLFLVATVWLGARSVMFFRGATVLQGTVTGIDQSVERADGGTSGRRMPIVTYVHLNGKSKNLVASAASLNCEVGSRVWVALNAEGGQAKLISLAEIFLWPACSASMGLIVLLLVAPLHQSSSLAFSILRLLGMISR